MVAYVTACVFNESTLALLIVMNVLGINCGPNIYIGTLKTTNNQIYHHLPFEKKIKAFKETKY